MRINELSLIYRRRNDSILSRLGYRLFINKSIIDFINDIQKIFAYNIPDDDYNLIKEDIDFLTRYNIYTVSGEDLDIFVKKFNNLSEFYFPNNELIDKKTLLRLKKISRILDET